MYFVLSVFEPEGLREKNNWKIGYFRSRTKAGNSSYDYAKKSLFSVSKLLYKNEKINMFPFFQFVFSDLTLFMMEETLDVAPSIVLNRWHQHHCSNYCYLYFFAWLLYSVLIGSLCVLNTYLYCRFTTLKIVID